MDKLTTRSTLFGLYIVGFILAFASALPAYIGSSFLATVTHEQYIGWVYIICAACTLFTFTFAPRLLQKYGNYKTILTLLTVNTASLLGLALSHNPVVILISFLAGYIGGSIIILCLDVFIEHNSSNGKTGEVRSIYLTCTNIAWLIAPWLSGFLVGHDGYWKVFLAAAYIMIPIIFIVRHTLKKFVDPKYEDIHFLDAIKDVYREKDIKNIFVVSLLLQFFFVIMVIYTPIYLHTYIGFDWGEIGLMFSIMLIPFVLIQVPIGELADKRYGEKEMLSIGLIIMAISTALIPLLSDKNFWAWAGLLFLTRIGAAMVQVMTDVYLFKKVGDKSVGIINLYRMTGATSSIVAPLVAMLFFFYFPFGNIFFLLGFLMFCGLRYSLALTDTK